MVIDNMSNISEKMHRKIVFNSIKLKLKNNEEFSLKIQGTSMMPHIKEGERVIVKSNDKNYSFGDLVLIDYGDFVVHRLLSVKTGMTKGDNLWKPDPQGLEIICKIEHPSMKLNKLYGIISYIHMILSKKIIIIRKKYL